METMLCHCFAVFLNFSLSLSLSSLPLSFPLSHLPSILKTHYPSKLHFTRIIQIVHLCSCACVSHIGWEYMICLCVCVCVCVCVWERMHTFLYVYYSTQTYCGERSVCESEWEIENARECVCEEAFGCVDQVQQWIGVCLQVILSNPLLWMSAISCAHCCLCLGVGTCARVSGGRDGAMERLWVNTQTGEDGAMRREREREK